MNCFATNSIFMIFERKFIICLYLDRYPGPETFLAHSAVNPNGNYVDIVYMYMYMYIYIYIMLRYNNKEYYFFPNSEIHVACATIFSQMNYSGQICYMVLVSYFKWCHNTNTGKSPLLKGILVKGIHVNNDENVCAICVT